MFAIWVTLVCEVHEILVMVIKYIRGFQCGQYQSKQAPNLALREDDL